MNAQKSNDPSHDPEDYSDEDQTQPINPDDDEPQMIMQTFDYKGSIFTQTCLWVKAFSVPNSLDPSQIKVWKEEGLIPKEANIFVPVEGHITADWHCPGWFSIHAYPFENGLKMPFSKFLCSYFEKVKQSPGQLSANCWQVLMGVDSLCKKSDLALSCDDLAWQYDVRSNTQGRFLFRSRCPSKDLIVGSGSVSWQEKFFFVQKSSLGRWADRIPDVMEVETIQMTKMARKKNSQPPAASAARLKAFLEIPLSVRTFPDCMMPDLFEPVQPVMTLPPTSSSSLISNRTRNKSVAPVLTYLSKKTSTDVRTSSAKALRNLIDLSLKPTSSLKPISENESSGSGAGINVESKVPVPESIEIAAKKRKRDAEEVGEVLGEKAKPVDQFSDPLIIGAEQVLNGPSLPQSVLALGLKNADMHRIGIGLMTQGLSYAIAATKASDQIQELLIGAKNDLEAERVISSGIAKQVADKDAAILDLQNRLFRAEELVKQYETENAAQKILLEQAEVSREADAKFCFQYGLVSALRADPGSYNLADEEEKLHTMEPEEGGEVSSSKVPKITDAAALDPVGPVMNQPVSEGKNEEGLPESIPK